MGQAEVGSDQSRIDAALKAAADLVDQWGQTSPDFTGRWLDPRNALIGVGLSAGSDDETIRELLQAVMPADVRVRIRLVSSEWVRLHQLQVRVSEYLDDHGIWGSYAVALGVDDLKQHVEIGLLPGTPDSIAEQILKQFPTQDVFLKRNASHAIAL